MASLQQLSSSKYTPSRPGRVIAMPVRETRMFYAVPPRKGWGRFGVSLVAHVVGLVLLTQIVLHAPQEFKKVSTHESVTLIAPAPYQPSHAVPRPAPQIKIKAPEPKVLAELRPPKIMPLPKPEIQPTIPKPALPPVVEQASLPAPAPVVPKQAPHVQSTPFGGGSSAAPTVKAPVREVQTGGFGDPNGVPGTGKKDAKVTIASLGSFDLPAGGGYGNGSGGTHGIRGTVASAGFGNGVAGPGNGNGQGRGGTVMQAGFGDASAPGPSAAKRSEPAKPQLTPVEITSKPRPVYTDEARHMHLQGEVLLDVTFTASGQVRVLRVVRGLGHGLDEAALRAAEQIRFKPAQREGQPYDSNAVVHIVFELAE